MNPPAPLSLPASDLLSREALAATLAELVRIDSVNPAYGGPAGGEAKVIARAAEILRAAGIEPEIYEAAPGRPNLSAIIPGRDTSRTLAFITHVDTVSTKGMTIAPHGAEIRAGRLWGRGSTDAKGQVVAMLHAFLSAAAMDSPPPANVEPAKSEPPAPHTNLGAPSETQTSSFGEGIF